MGRQQDTVAMATIGNAEAENMVQLSGEGILVSNSRNLMKRNSASRTISHAKQKRSAVLPSNSNVPSNQTTTKKPSTGLSNNSTAAPSSNANQNLNKAAETNSNSTSTDSAAIDSNSTIDLLTSSIPVDMNNTILLSQNESYVDDNDTLSFNQTEPLYDNVPRFVKSEVFIISMIVGICLLLTLGKFHCIQVACDQVTSLQIRGRPRIKGSRVRVPVLVIIWKE
jgi:hypothetical protein